MVEFHCAELEEAKHFPLHKRVDSVGIHSEGGQQYNHETFSTLNFKMPISILKFKFSIIFTFASYLGRHK